MSWRQQAVATLKGKATRQASALYFSQILGLLLGFLTVPITTRVLGPTNYGVFSFIGSLVAFVALFFEFGLITAGARLLAFVKTSAEERQLVGSLGLISLVLSLLLSVALLGLSDVVGPLFHQGAAIIPLRLGAFVAGFVPLRQLVQLVAQGTNKIGRLSIFFLTTNSLYFLGVVLLSTHGWLNIRTLLWLNYGIDTLIALLILVSFRPRLTGIATIGSRIVAEARDYGKKVYLGRIVDVSTYSLDSLLISFFRQASSVGFYNLATLLTSPFVLLSDSLTTSLFKDFGQHERIPAKVFLFNFVWLAGGLLLLSLLSPLLVPFLFSAAYLPVAKLLPILALAAFFQGMYKPYNSFFAVHGQGKQLQTASLLTGVVNVAANVTLIPLFGAVGAAFGSALGMLAYYLLCRRYYATYQAANVSAHTTPPDRQYFESLYQHASVDPWQNDQRISQKIRYQRIIHYLRQIFPTTTKILDIGCAAGDLTAELHRTLRADQTIGLDISATAIERARQRFSAGNLHFQQGDLTQLNEIKEKNFSLVTCLEVLYYLEPAERLAALKSIYQLLENGGTVLISVNVAPPPYLKLGELKTLLDQAGFEVVRTHHFYNKVYFWFERRALMLNETPLAAGVNWFLSQAWLFQFSQKMTTLGLRNRGITEEVVIAQKSR